MQVSLNTTATNHGKLHIMLQQADIKPQFSKELENIRKNAKIKGFRQGAVPISMIQKLYGEGIKAEIVNKLINQAVTDYQKDNDLSFLGDLLPVSEPLSESALTNEEIEFIFEVGIAPALNLDTFIQQSTLKKYILTFSEANIDAEMEAFLKHYSQLKETSDPIQANDLVSLKVQELEAGEIKTDGVQSEFSVMVDDQITDELKEQLLSKNLSDKLVINIQQVEKNQDDKTTRKYLLKLEDTDERIISNDFSAEIVKVSRKFIPEINEELFKSAFGDDTDVKSQEDLRNRLREDLSFFYNGETEKFMDLELSKKLSSYSELQYPDEFLKNWLSSSFEEWKNKPHADFDHDLIHFKEGLNWQLFKKAVMQKSELKIEMEDLRHIIVSKYKSQIPGLNFSEDQWNQVAMNVLKDKEKAQEFYQEAQNMKMLYWLKQEVAKEEITISLEEFKEKVKEINKHQHHHHDHEGHEDHEHADHQH